MYRSCHSGISIVHPYFDRYNREIVYIQFHQSWNINFTETWQDIMQTDIDIEFEEITRALPVSQLHKICRFSAVTILSLSSMKKRNFMLSIHLWKCNVVSITKCRAELINNGDHGNFASLIIKNCFMTCKLGKFIIGKTDFIRFRLSVPFTHYIKRCI